MDGEGSIDPIVAENTDKPIDFPTEAPAAPEAPPAPSGVTVTQEEIAAARSAYENEQRELSDLRQRAMSQNVDPKDIARAVAEAMKPPTPKPWETDDFVSNRQNLVNGMKAFYEEHTSSLRDELNQLKQIVPLLYARSQENPHFPQVQKAASDMAQKYGVPYQTALQWAMDNVKASPAPQKAPPPIPPSARLPGTGPSTGPARPRFTGNVDKYWNDLFGSIQS